MSYCGAAFAEPPARTYVKAGHLFDGASDKLLSDMIIVVAGERIERVAPAAQVSVPSGAQVIDLSQATVLPGLIDCHVHLAARPDHVAEIWTFKESAYDEAFAAVANAKRTLEAGFTTVRDLGSPPFLGVDLAHAVDEGLVPGPRVVAAGPMISATGGHGDLNDYAPEVHVDRFPAEHDFHIADSPDEMRHVVRAQCKHGVEWIKVAASGGVMSRGDQPGAPQLTVDELRAAVDTAHMAGRKVAAHAHGAQAIKNAVTAGVDTIEHGSLLDDEGARLMKQHGTWLVSDIYNDDWILGHAKEYGILDEYLEKERKIGRLQRENFRRAVKAGVKIAFGTDAGVYPHGDNAHQFAYMVEFGLTPAQALRAATASAAELLGRSDVGRIEAGRFADLIAVAGDPLSDIHTVEKVRFVMKGGRVFKEWVK